MGSQQDSAEVNDTWTNFTTCEIPHATMVTACLMNIYKHTLPLLANLPGGLRYVININELTFTIVAFVRLIMEIK